MPRKTATTESVAKFVSEYGYEIVGNFVHAHVNILLICPNKHEYYCRYSHFKSGTRCSTCNKENRVKRKINYYKDYVESNSGYTFIGLDSKQIKIKCPKGHEYLTCFQSFKNGIGCSQCSGNKKFTYEEVKQTVEIDGYTLISSSLYSCNF